MAACCGKTNKNEDASEEDAKDATLLENLPESKAALARVHAILDRMSSSECVRRKDRKKDKSLDEDDDDNDDVVHAQSNAVNDAMQLTARLWA
eukprot:90694-Karenia_brevis.AAC.1